MAIPLNKTNCLPETGLTFSDLIALTGIYGIHEPVDFDALRSSGQLKGNFEKEGNIAIVTFISPAVTKLTVHVHFVSKEIYIDLFRSRDLNSKIGLPRMISQVEAAIRLGYTKITLWAYGKKTTLPLCNGYIVWGKYGFLMYEPSDISDFKKLIVSTPYSSSPHIGDLLFAIAGTAFWRDNGKGWQGEFLVNPGSEHMRIFNGYRKKKGL